MVYLFLYEKSYVVKDFIVVCDRNFEVGLVCIKEIGNKLCLVILEVFYEVIVILVKKLMNFIVEDRFLLIKIDCIVVGLNLDDFFIFGDCVGYMIKLNQFKEVVVLLLDGIDYVMLFGKREKVEVVELFF